MQGLIFTIDKLGESLAAAENRIAQLEAENQALRNTPPSEPPASGAPVPAPPQPSPVAPGAAA